MSDKRETTHEVRLADFLDHEIAVADEKRILVLANDTSVPAEIRGTAGVTRIGDVEELHARNVTRFDVALITNERLATFACADSLRRTVAALRDYHARIVIVVDEGQFLELTDYLALGFERLEATDTDRAFIFDPDSPSRLREWNDARNWANPQNFDKFRW